MINYTLYSKRIPCVWWKFLRIFMIFFWKYPRILRTNWCPTFANISFWLFWFALSLPNSYFCRFLCNKRCIYGHSFWEMLLILWCLSKLKANFYDMKLNWAETGICWKCWVSSYWIKWVNIPSGRFKVRLVTRQWCSLLPPPPKLFWLHFWS